ncbi:MAG TPA: phospho-N-acetylmuramoyl-pentapeptide-transferase [bacterium]|nr:phospho-N-acetylmuramoyl-pentapeptide-transferase [bacterium]
MLLYLKLWYLQSVPQFNVLTYITFRTFMAVFTGFILSLIVYPYFIAYLKRIKMEQAIRTDGPQAHLAKAGTPAMGGVIILLSVLVNIFLWTDFLKNFWIQSMTLLIVLFGLIGYLDDWLKVSKRNPQGLASRWKFLMQVVFATAFMLLLYYHKGFEPTLVVPIFKSLTFDIGWWYIPFGVLVIVGTSNGLNFTDGMDGLAIVPTMISMLLLAIIVYLVGHAAFANYLHMPLVRGAGELAIIGGATIGAALAFLWFNSYPASIFMGDTGALSLGAMIGAFTVVTKTELLSLIFNGLFVVEVLSVILQVAFFKTTGRRIFRMAPIHHHFELGGNATEPKLIVRFWILSILLALLSIATIKVR